MHAKKVFGKQWGEEEEQEIKKTNSSGFSPKPPGGWGPLSQALRVLLV